MQNTANLGLKKPEGTDIVDISDLNGNMDKLDVEVTKLASTTENGRMSSADKVKLNGIAVSANNYVHPASHPATMITEDATHRFVTDAEKAGWNGKAGTAVATTSANGLMASADKIALNNSTGYGITAGTGAAYTVTLSPAPSSLAAGLRITVKFHAANTTTTPTINVNGLGVKTIVRPSGAVPVGFIKAAVYTLVYDGTAFTLQGEGGEYGTATAANVLAGKTIGTESGLVTGTMPDKGAITITPGQTAQAIPAGYHNGSGTVPAVSFDAAKVLSDTTIAGKKGTMPNRSGVSTGNVGVTAGGNGNLWLNTPEGYYNPTASVHAYDPNFVAGNIPADKNIFGVQGSIPRRGAYTDAISTGWDGNVLYVRFPQGVYQTNGGEGYPEITVSAPQARADGNIIPSNIRKGVWVYGVVGELEEGKKYASGTVMGDGNFITVNGLSFMPRMIRAHHQQDNGYSYFSILCADFYCLLSRNDATGVVYFSSQGDGSVHNGGFKLVAGNDDLWTWEAWG